MLKAFVALTLFLSSALAVSAKDWRGLVPLRSTREDVETLLGPPQPIEGAPVAAPKNSWAHYSIDEGEVNIAFADDENERSRECLNRVPAGTVLAIYVTPKDERPISWFISEEKKFRKFDPISPNDMDYVGYVNDEEGLLVRTFKGVVDTVVYFASALDKPLCPTYYQNFEESVKIYICGLLRKFDEYGDIAFADEKARLDNFAIQLKTQVNSRGYVIVYAGQRAFPAEAFTRGNRARNYLISKRRLEPDQLIVVDGGFREELSTELYVVPKDATPPVPDPTLKPDEVQIIYPKTRRLPR